MKAFAYRAAANEAAALADRCDRKLGSPARPLVQALTGLSRACLRTSTTLGVALFMLDEDQRTLLTAITGKELSIGR